jgi:hypothetical protein
VIASQCRLLALLGHAELTQASPLWGDEQTWLYVGAAQALARDAVLMRGSPQSIRQCSEAHPIMVVGQDVPRHFGVDVLERLHLEVRRSHPPEGMLTVSRRMGMPLVMTDRRDRYAGRRRNNSSSRILCSDDASTTVDRLRSCVADPRGCHARSRQCAPRGRRTRQ